LLIDQPVNVDTWHESLSLMLTLSVQLVTQYHRVWWPDRSGFLVRRPAAWTTDWLASALSSSVKSPPGRMPSENITCLGSTVDRNEPTNTQRLQCDCISVEWV